MGENTFFDINWVWKAPQKFLTPSLGLISSELSCQGHPRPPKPRYFASRLGNVCFFPPQDEMGTCIWCNSSSVLVATAAVSLEHPGVALEHPGVALEHLGASWSGPRGPAHLMFFGTLGIVAGAVVKPRKLQFCSILVTFHNFLERFPCMF